MVSSDPPELLTAVHDLVKREADLVAELTLVRQELKAAKKALNASNVATLMALKNQGSDSESDGEKATESESESEEDGEGDKEGNNVAVIAEQPAPLSPLNDVVAPQGVEAAVCDSAPDPPPPRSPVAPVSKAGAYAPAASIFGPVPASSPLPVLLDSIPSVASVAEAPPVAKAVTPKAKGRPAKRGVVVQAEQPAIADVPAKRSRGRPPLGPNGPCLACKYRDDGREGGKPHNYGNLCSNYGQKPPPVVVAVPKSPPALPAPIIEPAVAKAAGSASSGTSSSPTSDSD